MSKFGFQIFQSILVTLIVLFWIRRGLTYIIYANLISNHGTLEKHLSLSFYTIFLVCFDLSSVSQTLSLPPTDLLSLCWKSQLKSTCFVLTQLPRGTGSERGRNVLWKNLVKTQTEGFFYLTKFKEWKWFKIQNLKRLLKVMCFYSKITIDVTYASWEDS